VEEAGEEGAEDREVEGVVAGVEVSEAEVVVDLIIVVVEEEEEEVGEVSEEAEVDGIDSSLTFSLC
jgi:hypothetical protein